MDKVKVRSWEEASTEQKLSILAIAMGELGMAKALVMMHGQERGLRRYEEVGGHVRQDENGNPVVFLDGEWWSLSDE